MISVHPYLRLIACLFSFIGYKQHVEALKLGFEIDQRFKSVDLQGVTHVICCTGTTAFPSRRWNGDNTPEKVGKSGDL